MFNKSKKSMFFFSISLYVTGTILSGCTGSQVTANDVEMSQENEEVLNKEGNAAKDFFLEELDNAEEQYKRIRDDGSISDSKEFVKVKYQINFISNTLSIDGVSINNEENIREALEGIHNKITTLSSDDLIYAKEHYNSDAVLYMTVYMDVINQIAKKANPDLDSYTDNPLTKFLIDLNYDNNVDIDIDEIQPRIKSTRETFEFWDEDLEEMKYEYGNRTFSDNNKAQLSQIVTKLQQSVDAQVLILLSLEKDSTYNGYKNDELVTKAEKEHSSALNLLETFEENLEISPPSNDE